MNAALAGRVQQLEAEREHRAAVAEFRARRAADEQSRINALLSELVSALASLPFERPASPPRAEPCPACGCSCGFIAERTAA